MCVLQGLPQGLRVHIQGDRQEGLSQLVLLLDNWQERGAILRSEQAALVRRVEQVRGLRVSRWRQLSDAMLQQQQQQPIVLRMLLLVLCDGHGQRAAHALEEVARLLAAQDENIHAPLQASSSSSAQQEHRRLLGRHHHQERRLRLRARLAPLRGQPQRDDHHHHAHAARAHSALGSPQTAQPHSSQSSSLSAALSGHIQAAASGLHRLRGGHHLPVRRREEVLLRRLGQHTLHRPGAVERRHPRRRRDDTALAHATNGHHTTAADCLVVHSGRGGGGGGDLRVARASPREHQKRHNHGQCSRQAPAATSAIDKQQQQQQAAQLVRATHDEEQGEEGVGDRLRSRARVAQRKPPGYQGHRSRQALEQHDNEQQLQAQLGLQHCARGAAEEEEDSQDEDEEEDVQEEVVADDQDDCATTLPAPALAHAQETTRRRQEQQTKQQQQQQHSGKRRQDAAIDHQRPHEQQQSRLLLHRPSEQQHEPHYKQERLSRPVKRANQMNEKQQNTWCYNPHKHSDSRNLLTSDFNYIIIIIIITILHANT